jgi:hypothetical protein
MSNNQILKAGKAPWSKEVVLKNTFYKNITTVVIILTMRIFCASLNPA